MIRIPDGLKHTLLYGSSIALMKGVSLLMLPFIAHHLSPDEFGRLEVISTIAVIGSVLVGMGLDHTLFRFAGVAKNEQQRKRLSAEIFTLALFIGILAWLVSWLAAEFISNKIPGNPTTYELRLVISMLALEGCIAIPLGWLRMRNKAFTFFIATTGRAFTQALLVVIFLNFDRGVEGVLEAGLISTVALAIALGYLHIRDTGISFNIHTSKRTFIYSLPLVGSGLVAFALNGLDRWVLAEYTSLTDVAQFGVAAKFALAMVLLMQPFSMWWSPKRFEVLNATNGHQRVANFIAIGISLSLIIAVLVGLCAPLIIQWLMPASFAISSDYVIALVLVMLLREITELVNLGCFTGNTTITQFSINLVTASAGVIAMFIFAPTMGVWGIITALLIAQSLRLILFFLISQYFVKLPYPARSLALFCSICFCWLIMGINTTAIEYQIISIVAAAISLLAIALLLKLIPLPLIYDYRATNR